MARLVWLRQRRPNWSRELLSRGRAARPETTTRASWSVSRRHLLREGGVASPQPMARRHVWPASRPRLIFGRRRGGGQCRRQGHAPSHAGVLEWHISSPSVVTICQRLSAFVHSLSARFGVTHTRPFRWPPRAGRTAPAVESPRQVLSDLSETLSGLSVSQRPMSSSPMHDYPLVDDVGRL